MRSPALPVSKKRPRKRFLDLLEHNLTIFQFEEVNVHSRNGYIKTKRNWTKSFTQKETHSIGLHEGKCWRFRLKSNNKQVHLRIRPLLSSEVQNGEAKCIDIVDENTISTTAPPVTPF